MKLNFFHIPKNVGTSIRNLIANCKLPNVTYHNHWIDPKKYPSESSIMVIRDPIDRFTSAFNYMYTYPGIGLYKHPDINNPDKFANLFYDTPEAAKKLINRNHFIGSRRFDIDWVFIPQSEWYNDPRYVLRYSHLTEDLNKLTRQLGVDPITNIPLLNRSRAIDFTYSEKALDFIREYYADDFKIYSKHYS